MYQSYDPVHRHRNIPAESSASEPVRALPRLDSTSKAGGSTSGHELLSSSTASSYDAFTSRESSSWTGTDDLSEDRHQSRDSNLSFRSVKLDEARSDGERPRELMQQTLASCTTRPASPPQRSRQRPKTQVTSACANCKKDHLSCDTNRPCRRCVTTNKQSSCESVEPKKRGRPKLSGPAAAASAQSRASKRKKYQQSAPRSESGFANQGPDQPLLRPAQPLAVPYSSSHPGRAQPLPRSEDYRYPSRISIPPSQSFDQHSPDSRNNNAAGLYTAFPVNPGSSAGASSAHSSTYESINRPPTSGSEINYGVESRAYQFNDVAATLPPTGPGLKSTRREHPSSFYDQHPPGSSIVQGAPGYMHEAPYYDYPSRQDPVQRDPNNRLPPPTDNRAYNPGPTLPTLQPGVRPGPDTYHERLRPATARAQPQAQLQPTYQPPQSNRDALPRHRNPQDEQESRNRRVGHTYHESRGEGHGSQRSDEDERQRRPGPEQRSARPRRIWEQE